MIHTQFINAILKIIRTITVSSPVALLLLNGCIEHTFNISIINGETVKIEYHAKGDPMDFDDEGQLMPDSLSWQVHKWTEKKDDEKEYHLEAFRSIDLSADLNSILDWKRNIHDTLYLKSDYKLEREQKIFGVTWHFRGILYSRNFKIIYGDIWDYIPSECKALEDENQKKSMSSDEIQILEDKFALGVIQWNISRYDNLFDRVWQKAAVHISGLKDTSETILSIARAGWAEDLHQYMNNLDIKNPSTLNLDWWSDLRPLFLGRLVDVTGSETADIFSRIGDSFEREYQITKDIEDDSYKFNLELPGTTSATNGSKGKEGQIKWEITGGDLQNEDKIMTLRTFELSIWRAVIAAFILILILNLIRRGIRKKSTKGVD